MGDAQPTRSAQCYIICLTKHLGYPVARRYGARVSWVEVCLPHGRVKLFDGSKTVCADLRADVAYNLLLSFSDMEKARQKRKASVLQDKAGSKVR